MKTFKPSAQREGLIFSFFIILILFGSACVPTKKLTYLQYGDDRKGDNELDSIVRSYEQKRKVYRLKPEDIISIRVASLTEEEYNFIKQYETDLGLIRKLDQYDTRGESGRNNNNNNNRGIGGGLNTGGGGISSLALDRQNTGFVLDLNGELDLPEIGVIQLAGLTLPEAEMKVKEKLEGYYEAPMVRIQLLNFHYTIIGEVENEGRFTNYDPEMDVFDAISISGNLTEYADRSNIKIIRQEEGMAKVIYLDLLDEESLAANNYFLKRDDLIIVGALDARTTQTYTLPNIARTLGIVSAVLSLTALIISLNN